MEQQKSKQLLKYELSCFLVLYSSYCKYNVQSQGQESGAVNWRKTARRELPDARSCHL
jgi:hypothetical protein